MSSQVPAGSNESWTSDIAFESNYPYSLHPIAENDQYDLNFGGYFETNTRGQLLFPGGFLMLLIVLMDLLPFIFKRF